MRKLTALVVLIIGTVAFAQTRPASPVLDGSWKSENLGLDFPIWMVDTYSADGSVRTDFYSKPKDKEIHHKDETRGEAFSAVPSFKLRVHFPAASCVHLIGSGPSCGS